MTSSEIVRNYKDLVKGFLAEVKEPLQEELAENSVKFHSLIHITTVGEVMGLKMQLTFIFNKEKVAVTAFETDFNVSRTVKLLVQAMESEVSRRINRMTDAEQSRLNGMVNWGEAA